MGNVLIIKNNNMGNNIYKYAEKSLKTEEMGYYNGNDDTNNGRYLKSIKEQFGEDGIVLLITYDGADENRIKDVFIGSDVKINEKNNANYRMQIHLSGETEQRTIESIIDKIDLDISKDFEYGCYVMMSTMESLYEELRERIMAKKFQVERNVNKPIKRKEKAYQLAEYAQKDYQAKRIYKSGEVGEYRTEFQRDRERVVNCRAFRRMVDKAQIFSAEKGDYYRTRMTHSLEVNQIAKAIAYALHLNLDLTEAIALGHDLGHTPFGHQGERTLDDILSGKIDVEIGVEKEWLKKYRCFGGFKHNYQSARILTQIEEKYVDFPGLNVSVQVVEGVLKHTKMNPEIPYVDFLNEMYKEEICIIEKEKKQVCATLEGQTVAIADEIAQRGHDVDDALTSGVMTIDEFMDKLKIGKCEELKERIQQEIEKVDGACRGIADKKGLKIARIVSAIITYMINTTIQHSKKVLEEEKVGEITMKNQKEYIGFSEEVSSVNLYLERVVQKKVICNSEVARADYNANMIVKTLFQKYYANPRLLHEGTIHKIFLETLNHKNENVSNSAVNLNDVSVKLVNEEIEQLTKRKLDDSIIEDYLKKGKGDETDEKIIIFEKRKILIRCIIDYIAGMTDGYAIEEYERLK